MGDIINKAGLSSFSPLNFKADGKKMKKEEPSIDISTNDLISISNPGDWERPSADFNTNRAKLIHKTIENAGSAIMESVKKSNNPKFIPLFDDGIQFDINRVESLNTKLKGEIEDATAQMTGAKASFEEPTNTDINQTQYVSDLLAKLGSGARLQNQHDISKLTGRIPSVAELNSEFKKLSGDKSIPFEYIVDGCYARAHLMCQTMMKDDINCGKMFVMVEDPMGSDRLTAKNKFMNAEWWYHVAPLVFAKDDITNKIEGFIMDPSMANRPLKAEEWIGMMRAKNVDIKVDINRASQFGPIESDGENATFEESLEPSKEVAKEYSVVLKEIKDEYYAHHPDEKPDKHRKT
jgi:hypothetical protein